MTGSSDNWRHSVLIVHPDYESAAEIGTLIERSGWSWEFRPDIEPDEQEAITSQWDVVFVPDVVFPKSVSGAQLDLRTTFSPSTVLVGVLDSRLIELPALFGAGVDLVLYRPLVLADIERALAFAEAVKNETRAQARDRLRKMTALHELAVASGHRSRNPGWMSQLIRAGAGILGVDALAMWSLDRQNAAIRCIGSVGLTDEYIRAAEENAPILMTVYDELPKQLPSHWVRDTDTESNFRIIAPEAARKLGIRQLAWLPVRDSSRLYGHLSFYFMSDETFEKYDLVLADAFASIVAAALATYWLESEIRRTNRLYRENVEMSPDGVVVCHLDGTVERSNEAIERITGYDRYELIENSIFEWFVNPDELPWREWTEQDHDTQPESIQLWLVRKNGERRRVSCYARRVQFPDPRTLKETEVRIQIIVQDVTEQARRLVELELFYDLTRLISRHGSIEDAYDLVVSRLYEYLNYRFVAIGHVVDRRRMYLQAFRSHMEGVEIPTSLGVESGITGMAVRENQSVLVEDVSQCDAYLEIDDEVVSELATVIRRGGEPVGIVDVMTDATQPLDNSDLQLVESVAAHLGLLIEQVTAQERLERQAMTDPLTGMANRRAFMQHLQALVADRESSPWALLLVEVDHFKSVNDRFGHLFGDEVLKEVANRLASVLRAEDFLARYGGDEIAIISRDVSPSAAHEVAMRLSSVINSEPFSYNGMTTSLSVSIGIALFPHHGRLTDELIGEADRAMYAAKLQGRNTVHGDLPGIT